MSESEPTETAEAASRVSRFYVGDWLVEPSWNRISRAGETVKLEPRVMKLLNTLAASPGCPLQRQQLLDTIWPETFVNEEALSRAVSQLRRALGDDSRTPRYVETVHKAGYCLIAPVSATAEPGASSAPPPGRRDPHRLGWLLPAAVALFLLGGIGAFLLYRDLGSSTEPAALRRLVPLTSDPGREIDPAISPDGTRVAYLASGESGYDLFVRGIDGSAALRLTGDGRAKGHLAWSPSGDRLAFVAAEGNAAAIYILPSSGGEARKLIDLPAWSFGLDWSPDGRTLAYADSAPGDKPGIVLLDIETRARRPIARGAASNGDTKPVYSPDGARLAFLRNDALERQQVVVVNLRQSGDAASLLGSPQPLRGLDWAPDGASVIVAARSGRRFGLWRLPLNENAAPEALRAEGGELFNPSVSSDGRIVVEEVAQDRDIWVAGLDGIAPAPLIRSTSDDFEPTYGPGGTLAFVSERSGAPEIWLRGATGEPRRLTSLSGPEIRQIIWSPDGARIAFAAEANGDGCVYLVDIRGGKAVCLTGVGAGAVPVGWAGGPETLSLLVPATGGFRLEEYSLSERRRRELAIPLLRFAALAGDGRSLLAVTAGENKLVNIVSAHGIVNEMRLPPLVEFSALMAGTGAIYLVEDAPGAAIIHRVDFGTGTLTAVKRLDEFGGGTVSLSPDGRFFAFTRAEETSNDLAWLRL